MPQCPKCGETMSRHNVTTWRKTENIVFVCESCHHSELDTSEDPKDWEF